MAGITETCEICGATIETPAIPMPWGAIIDLDMAHVNVLVHYHDFHPELDPPSHLESEE